MAGWVRDIFRHGTDADIPGMVGEWLQRVRDVESAGGDAVGFAASPDDDLREAAELGAPADTIRAIRGYRDPTEYGDGARYVGPEPPRDRNHIIAWGAVRHHLLVDTLKDGEGPLKLGTVLLPGNVFITLDRGAESDRSHALKGFNAVMWLDSILYMFALDANDPVRAIRELGSPTYARLCRYATTLNNKTDYRLDRGKVIRLGEECAHDGPDLVSRMFDALYEVHTFRWDAIMPVTADVLRSLEELPEGFVRESIKAEGSIPELDEYRESLKTMEWRMDTAMRSSMSPLMHGLLILPPDRREDGLAIMERLERDRHLLTRPLVSDEAALTALLRCRNEMPIHAVRRLERMLDRGEDGVLRWSILSETGHVVTGGHRICPDGYAGYIADGSIPENLAYRNYNFKSKEIRIGGDGRMTAFMESMPTTMEGFRKATGPGGEYEGCVTVRDMVNEALAGFHAAIGHYRR